MSHPDGLVPADTHPAVEVLTSLEFWAGLALVVHALAGLLGG